MQNNSSMDTDFLNSIKQSALKRNAINQAQMIKMTNKTIKPKLDRLSKTTQKINQYNMQQHGKAMERIRAKDRTEFEGDRAKSTKAGAELTASAQILLSISHKIELIPNNKAKTHFKKAFRFAYNWGLTEWQEYYK